MTPRVRMIPAVCRYLYGRGARKLIAPWHIVVTAWHASGSPPLTYYIGRVVRPA